MKYVAAVFLLFSFFVFSTPVSKKLVCQADDACYSYPENCQMQDCEVVLSLGANSTEIFMNNFKNDKEFVIIYTETNGVRSEKMVFCLAGARSCSEGIEKIDRSHFVLFKLNSEMAVVTEESERYLYNLDSNVFKTGAGIKYTFSKGKRHINDVKTPIKPLYSATILTLGSDFRFKNASSVNQIPDTSARRAYRNLQNEKLKNKMQEPQSDDELKEKQEKSVSLNEVIKNSF